MCIIKITNNIYILGILTQLPKQLSQGQQCDILVEFPYMFNKVTQRFACNKIMTMNTIPMV